MIQNFGSNVVQMQLNNNLANEDGSLNQTGQILDILDFFFTIIFAFELSLNVFAHWFRQFINDGWNWFDSPSHTIFFTRPICHRYDS